MEEPEGRTFTAQGVLSSDLDSRGVGALREGGYQILSALVIPVDRGLSRDAINDERLVFTWGRPPCRTHLHGTAVTILSEIAV